MTSTQLIPIGLLREGDRFTAIADNGSISGVVTMDGHAISPHYGVSQGNYAFVGKDRGYINVQLDNRSEDYYTPLRPNESLWARDGWSFSVETDEKRIPALDPTVAHGPALLLESARIELEAASEALRKAIQMHARAKKEYEESKALVEEIV